MNYADYPVVLLENVQNTFQKLRNKVKENDDILRIVKDENLELKIEYTRKGYDFKFSVANPNYSNNHVSFKVLHLPSSNREKGLFNMPIISSSKEEILNRFNHWLNILKKYENISIHPKDKVLRDYENRFFQVFSFLDDKSDDKALSFKNRTLLNIFIDKTIGFLVADDSIEDSEEKNEIIEELKELNKYLPQLTQGQIKKRIAVLYSRIYFQGVDIINWIVKEGKSVGFGQILIEGFKGLMGG
ncbi:hypothetical protein [Winogradskyella ouciana]|uniref:hypothetical protein n=1 Tax=Winogradskyella ouciana TaxID=2608631 RepID=UPI003D2E15ED